MIEHVLTGLTLGDDAAAWRSLGLIVDDGRIVLDNLVLHIGVGGKSDGSIGLAVRGASAGDVDGIPLQTDLASAETPTPEHPSGAFEVDHVVIGTHDMERTTAALATLGWTPRRTIRSPRPGDERTMRFFVVPSGDEDAPRRTVIEMIQPDEVPDPSGAAKIWGFVLNVHDLDAAVQLVGADVVSAPKPAVQPDRRIATVRGDAVGLRLRVALMTPRAGASD